MINISIDANAAWKITVTQRGGKNTPCGVRFNYVRHYTKTYNETITCKGRGNLDCPEPTHTGGIAVQSVIEAVTKGATEGKLVDYQSLSVTTFGNGSYSIEDEAASFDADILMFETLEEMNEYLVR